MFQNHIHQPSQLPTPIPPPSNLPPTQPHLQRHPQKPRYTNPTTITHRHRPQTEFSLLFAHPLTDFRKRIDVNGTAQQSFPEYDDEDEPNGGDVGEEGLEDQEGEVEDLEEGREIEVVEAEKGGGGAGEEDAGFWERRGSALGVLRRVFAENYGIRW